MENSPTSVIAKFTSSTPVDLEGMIAALGISLHREALGQIAGKLQRDGSTRAGYKIVVNSNDNPRRQRFTMAHEVAHFVLHRDLLREGVVDDALYRSSLSDEYERQADRFAAQILLPAQAVRSAFKSEKSFAGLGQLFNASADALRIRLKDLGLGP